MSAVMRMCRICQARGMYCKRTYQYLDLCERHAGVGAVSAEVEAVKPVDWDVLVTEGPHAALDPIPGIESLPTIPGSPDMTWNYLFGQAYDLFISDKGVKPDPEALMRFTVSVCTPGSRPTQITTIALDEEHHKTAGCHEADFFGSLDINHDEGILLIMQSHGPCKPCCNAFGAWARRRGSPIIVSFKLASSVMSPKGTTNIPRKQAGTYVFMPESPGSPPKDRKFYSLRWNNLPHEKPKKEEKKPSSSSSSSSSSTSSTTTTTATPTTSSGTTSSSGVTALPTPSTPARTSTSTVKVRGTYSSSKGAPAKKK